MTAPPVDSCTTSSVDSRSAVTVSVSRARSSVGRVSASRTCTCTTLAPMSAHARAVRTSSSSVTGSAGASALAVSAPVGATVIIVVGGMPRSWQTPAGALAAVGRATHPPAGESPPSGPALPRCG